MRKRTRFASSFAGIPDGRSCTGNAKPSSVDVRCCLGADTGVVLLGKNETGRTAHALLQSDIKP